MGATGPVYVSVSISNNIELSLYPTIAQKNCKEKDRTKKHLFKGHKGITTMSIRNIIHEKPLKHCLKSVKKQIRSSIWQQKVNDIN